MITDSDWHEMVKLALIELVLLIPFALLAIWLSRRPLETSDDGDDMTEGEESSAIDHEKTTSV